MDNVSLEVNVRGQSIRVLPKLQGDNVKSNCWVCVDDLPKVVVIVQSMGWKLEESTVHGVSKRRSKKKAPLEDKNQKFEGHNEVRRGTANRTFSAATAQLAAGGGLATVDPGMNSAMASWQQPSSQQKGHSPELELEII